MSAVLLSRTVLTLALEPSKLRKLLRHAHLFHATAGASQSAGCFLRFVTRRQRKRDREGERETHSAGILG